MINSAIHRMINLPLTTQAVDAETKNISAIAALNGLKINTDLLIKCTRLRKILAETRDMGDFSKKEKFKWMRLPYLGGLTEKLSSELRKYGYHVGFYPLTTL